MLIVASSSSNSNALSGIALAFGVLALILVVILASKIMVTGRHQEPSASSTLLPNSVRTVETLDLVGGFIKSAPCQI